MSQLSILLSDSVKKRLIRYQGEETIKRGKTTSMSSLINEILDKELPK